MNARFCIAFGLVLVTFAACSDQTVDPGPAKTDAGPGSTAPASNCSSRCAAIAVSCGSDPADCASLCLSITEGQLSCIEESDCGGSATCTGGDAGAFEAGSGEGGQCTALSSACRSAAECCSGAECTNKLGTSNMVCCEGLASACTADQDCCSANCSSAGKCCYGETVSCTAANAASCCSGVCGSNGLCNP